MAAKVSRAGRGGPASPCCGNRRSLATLRFGLLLAVRRFSPFEQLTDEDVPYEVGMAYYREVARGQIRGDTTGRLKLIFHRDTRLLLGVHIIGEGACELIHIGQAVMILGGTVDYFVETVFNYPTLAECYKAAAFNGLNKLSRVTTATSIGG